MKKLTLSLLVFIISLNTQAINCPQLDKTVICHAGSVKNPNYVSICVDFASLWGHFAHHEMDMYGECPTQSLEPYACNAGLKHPTPQTTICQQVDNNKVVDSCEGSKNCVCSYKDDKQNKLDYMKFKMTRRNSSNQSESRLVQADIDDFAYAFSNEEFGAHEIESDTLSFNFGSERIGSEYFVDFCLERPTANSEAHEIYSSMILNSSVLHRSPYIDQTGLKVKTSIYCGNDLDPFSDVYNFLYSESSYARYPNGGLYIYPVVPRKNLCVLRYSFKENESLPYMRNWLHNNVKASSIVDSLEDDTTPVEEPVEICHVKRVGANSYECTNLYFNSGEEYIQYILKYNNVAAWKQDHQHDYKGQCLSSCGPL